AFGTLSSGSHAIVPGNLNKSKLVERITHSDKSKVMPPAKTGKTLSAEEIVLLKQWIEQGAPWEDQWAFIPPVRPKLPKVQNKAWPRNAIDYFVLERLEQEGMKPSQEAVKATLIRRVYLDLIGLPPTPAQVQAFVNDQSPN